MKRYLTLLSFFPLLWSCTEEVSKDINTDLTVEATHFFNFSEAMLESTYLGNISYPEYARIISGNLPGCPEVTLSTDSRIITLNYDAESECEQENNTPRTGRIVLDFSLSNSDTSSWTLTYEEYTYRGNKIEGTRHFERITLMDNKELFEDLSVELAGGLTFYADGELSYSVVRADFGPSSLTIKGKIGGRNPAGRNFSLVTTEAKIQQFQCYSAGWELPQSGKESWIVSRSATTDLEYKVNFQSSETCDPLVTSTLPDGRSLNLNP
jgi:hypothetical protein